MKDTEIQIQQPAAMFNGDPFEVSIRPRSTSTSDDEHRDSAIEMHELKRRGARTTTNNYNHTSGNSNSGFIDESGSGSGSGSRRETVTSNVDTILYDKEIEAADTLQSIALTHHVTVAELKRVNNLLNDQDFHALRYIKVPIKKYGILSEQLPVNDRKLTPDVSEVRSWNTSPDGSTYGDLNENYAADSDDDDSESRGLLIRTLSIRDSITKGKQTKDARKFLERMDVDLEKIRSSTNSYKNSLDEVRETLTCQRIHPLHHKNAWNGANCGIGMWNALICVITVALLVPLLCFIFYVYSTHSSDSNPAGGAV